MIAYDQRALSFGFGIGTKSNGVLFDCFGTIAYSHSTVCRSLCTLTYCHRIYASSFCTDTRCHGIRTNSAMVCIVRIFILISGVHAVVMHAISSTPTASIIRDCLCYSIKLAAINGICRLG